MDFKILVIRNRIKYDISDNVNKFTDWIKRHTPLNPILTYIDSDLNLKWKFFTNLPGNANQPLYGLDGIKDEILNSGLSTNGHDSIFLIYEETEYSTPGYLGAFTYPNKLNGAAFSEIHTQAGLQQANDLYRLLSHEIVHQFIRILWDKNIMVKDDMDLYDQEGLPDASDGNRTRNINRISPYWSKIVQNTSINFLAILKLIGNLFLRVKSLRLNAWALAIQQYEGYYQGSASFRNNNPGNLKYTRYTESLGATASSQNGFAIFPTYQVGFSALKQFLKDASSGVLPAYKGVTIIGFFEKYSPSSDGNEPLAYANFVAKKVVATPQTLINTLV